MTTTYKELLRDTFSDVAGLTPDKLTTLVEETMKYFQGIQEKLVSKEPGAREEALKDSLELREMLEKQMAALCEATGLDPSQLAAYAENTASMSPQEKAVIDEVKQKLKALQPHQEAKARKKSKHLKIIG